MKEKKLQARHRRAEGARRNRVEKGSPVSWRKRRPGEKGGGKAWIHTGEKKVKTKREEDGKFGGQEEGTRRGRKGTLTYIEQPAAIERNRSHGGKKKDRRTQSYREKGFYLFRKGTGVVQDLRGKERPASS